MMQTVKDQMNQFGWTSIRRLGNSRAAKLTFIAPFIPFIFSLFDTIVQIPGITEFLGRFTINWPRPTLTSLYWFYYGLMSVALASFVYAWRCPDIVKQYSSAASFAEREARFIGPTQVQNMAVFVRSSLEKTSATGRANYFSRPEWDQVAKGVDSLFIGPDYETAIMHMRTVLCQEYYLGLDRDRLISRSLSLAFYTIGFVLIAVPTLA